MMADDRAQVAPSARQDLRDVAASSGFPAASDLESRSRENNDRATRILYSMYPY